MAGKLTRPGRETDKLGRCRRLPVGQLTITLAAQINNSAAATFIVDVGSRLSIVSPTAINTHSVQPTTAKLSSIENDPIRLYGRVNLSVKLRPLCRSYKFPFFVSDVRNNVIGLDFVHENKMSIDCRNLVITDDENWTHNRLTQTAT